MADVQVEFGAKVSELIDAVDQVKSKLTELSGHTESVASHFGVVWANALLELGEKAIKAFEKISAFVEKMAELGEQAENFSKQLGVSVETIGELGGIAASVGVGLEGMTLSMERLMISVQHSERDAFNPAAQALQRLGLSARDFRGLNADQAFLKLADAAARFNPNMTLSTALMELGGRGMQRLIPIINEGRDRIEEMRARIREVGGTTQEWEAGSLTRLNSSIVVLKAALTGLGGSFVAAFGPLVAAAIDKIATGIGYITAGVRWLRDVAMYGPDRERGQHDEENKEDLAAADALARQKLEIKAMQIDRENTLEKEKIEANKLQYMIDVSHYSMTETQRTIATANADIRIAQLDLDAAIARRNLWQRGTIEWEKEESKRVEAAAKIDLAIKARERDTTASIAAEWEKIGNAISGALNSQIRGLLEGTKTWGDAFKGILEEIIIKVIEATAQLILMKTIVESIKMAFPELAPLTLASSFIPKMQEGTPYVARTGLALIHQGEMVIPSGMADMVRGGQAGIGGGGNTQISIAAWDGASVQTWLRNGGAHQISKAIARNWNQNPNMRPAY